MDTWFVSTFQLLQIRLIETFMSVCTDTFISFGQINAWEYNESYGICMFNLLRNCQTFLQSGCTILYPHQQCMRIPLVPYLPPNLVWSVFNSKHSSKCVVESHCGLYFLFQMTKHVKHIFMCL